MKKLPLGIAFILFGILLELAELNNIWIPVIDVLFADVFGLIFGVVGVGFAIAGCFEKKQ